MSTVFVDFSPFRSKPIRYIIVRVPGADRSPSTFRQLWQLLTWDRHQLDLQSMATVTETAVKPGQIGHINKETDEKLFKISIKKQT